MCPQPGTFKLNPGTVTNHPELARCTQRIRTHLHIRKQSSDGASRNLRCRRLGDVHDWLRIGLRDLLHGTPVENYTDLLRNDKEMLVTAGN